MKPLIYTFLIIFSVIIIVGLGSILLVLWAYGAGQVLLEVLPGSVFTSFEATLLNLVGVLIVGMLVVRFITSATTETLTPPKKSVPKVVAVNRDSTEAIDQPKDGGASDVEGEDAIEAAIDADNADARPGIPLWRRPLKTVDFSKVKPNAPCPCGSGRKFRQCHGYKRAEKK